MDVARAVALLGTLEQLLGAVRVRQVMGGEELAGALDDSLESTTWRPSPPARLDAVLGGVRVQRGDRFGGCRAALAAMAP
jgi:hypothetical protein